MYSDKKTDNCENCRYSPCNARLIADKEEYARHGGFCSQECFEKALATLLIKDTESDFDTVNYRKLRLEMRDHPERKQEILDKYGERLSKKYGKVIFRHKTSQKEEFVMD